MGSDIRNLSHECDEIFRRVSEAHEARSHAVVEVLHQQFEQWTGNLGVYAKPHLSLDANLQDSESLRKLVLQLLQLIKKNLERVEREEMNENTDEPASAIVSQMSQWSSTELSSLLVESLKALESGVDSLQRLGFAIQQASASTLTQRINNFIEKKGDCTLEETVYLHLKHRLVARAQERDGTQGAASSLCRQLAASISFRYFGIIYKRSHHAKKHDDKATKDEAVLSTSHQQKTSKPVLQHHIHETRQSPPTKGKSLLQLPHLMHDVPPSDTAPSSPDSKIARQIYYMTPPKSSFGAKSVISVHPPEGVRYPKAPKVVPPGRSALCPICCKYHDRGQLENRGWWKRHVDQELRLYTCISEECAEPPQIFARFEEWKQHMDTEHSRQWVCDIHLPLKWYCSMEHDEQDFEDEAAFEQHVKSQHPEYSGELELEGLKDLCAIKIPRPAHACPICNTVPENLASVLRVDNRGVPTADFDDEEIRVDLLRHIAQHLKQVGFMSTDYLEEDDGIGSLMTDEASKKGLPDGTWIDGEWQPSVSPYLDDNYKSYSPDREHVDDVAEEWTWIASQKGDIVLDWIQGTDLSELLSCDDPEHAVRERLLLTRALGGQDHPHTIHCLFALTIVLAYNQQSAEAETALLDALELCATISFVDESTTTNLLERLYDALHDFNRQDLWKVITQNVKGNLRPYRSLSLQEQHQQTVANFPSLKPCKNSQKIIVLLRELHAKESDIERILKLKGVNDFWIPLPGRISRYLLEPRLLRDWHSIQAGILSTTFDFNPSPDPSITPAHFNLKRTSCNKRGHPTNLCISKTLGTTRKSSVVQVGMNGEIDNQFSLKIIPRKSDFEEESKQMRLITREISALRKLRHPHYVQLIASYTTKTSIGIVISPVADCDLDNYLDQFFVTRDFRQEKQDQLARFFGCLAQAVANLHCRHRICHNNINPKDILIRGDQVFLTGFGIALECFVPEDEDVYCFPKSTAYCAPEIWYKQQSGMKSDIWSLGCVFLEMALVLEGLSANHAKKKIESGRYLDGVAVIQVWIDRLRRNYSRWRCEPLDWIQGMIKEEREDRWKAADVIEAILTSELGCFAGYCCSVWEEPDFEDDEDLQEYRDHEETKSLQIFENAGEAIATAHD